MIVVATAISAQHKTEVKYFNLAGPFKVTKPLALDTVDVKGNKYDEKSQMESLPLSAPPK